MIIIAECCTNWYNLTEAKEMIRVAHEINPEGMVKFQLYNADDDKGKPHYDWVKDHELTFEQAKELFDYGESIGQEVFFSVFGVKYVDWCERIGVKRYKIASCEGNNRLLISKILDTKKPLIRSDGLDTQCLIFPNQKVLQYAIPLIIPKIPVYPKYQSVSCDVPIGFSDHTIGLDAAKIALSRDAQIIEKHFCLEHNKDFPDNDWSMTPLDLKELVRWEKICKEVL